MTSRQDLFGAALIGFLIAVLFLVLSYTTVTVISPEIKRPPIYYWASLLLFPVLTSLGIVVLADLARRLSGILRVFFQFYKFGLVGVFNTFVDLTILNGFITATEFTSGWYFSLFKGISFVVAVTNSYFWNKFWTFRREQGANPVEFGKFILISAGGLAINVGVASFFVNIVGPLDEMNPRLWANISALLAILFSMIWNFAGYKIFVFKMK